jgi:hypothetical protein
MPGEKPIPRLAVWITSPRENDEVRAPGEIEVKGETIIYEPGGLGNTVLQVRIGSGGPWETVGTPYHGEWSIAGHVSEASDTLTITALVRGKAVLDKPPDGGPMSVTVKVKSDAPPRDIRLSIDAPSSLAGQAQTTYVPVRVDASAGRGIKRLSWRVNGEVVDSIGLSQSDKEWSGVRNLPISTPTHATDYTIAVKCKDHADKEENAELVVSISGVGEPAPPPAQRPRLNPPQYEIIVPREGMKFGSLDGNAVIRIRGTARNVLGVKTVEWSLDKEAFQPASYDPASSVWWAEVKMGGFGPHLLNVRFTDNNGYSTTLVRNTGIKKPTKYESLEQIIDPQAYLQDLLAYANAHVLAPDKPLEATMLNAVFHQSFDELAKPPEKPEKEPGEFGPVSKPVLTPGNQPINQVRLTVEVLREYFRRQWQVLAPAGAQAALLAGSERRGLIAAPPKRKILAKEKRSARDLRTLAASAAEDGLSAHWQFDEGKGLVAGDASGNENELTLLAAQWATGRTGGALFFNGASALALRKTPSYLYMGKTMSACAWIYPQGPGTVPEGGVILIKEGEYALARLADGRLQWIFANANPGWQWVDTGYVVRENEWTHVAVVYNDGSVTTFANGQPVHNFVGAGAIGNVDDRADQISLGGRAWSAQFFHGLMEEVRIYRRALGPEEVVKLAV